MTWSAPLDLNHQPVLASPAENYVGCTCRARLTDASPLFHVSAGDTPLELFNSADEDVPLAQVQTMRAELAAAEVPNQLIVYPGHAHASDYAQQAMPQPLSFLKAELAG